MIEAAICRRFVEEVWRLEPHRPGDDFRLALYTAEAELGPQTETYTPKAEVQAKGYKAGGAGVGDITRTRKVKLVWSAATIRARGALVYNASRSNRAVAVLDFGAEIQSTNDDFSVMCSFPLVSFAKPKE